MQTIIAFLLITIKFSSFILAVSDTEWLSYKKQYEKSYPTKLDDLVRRELYQDSLDEVNEFNAKQAIEFGFKIGTNQFSDLTKMELKRLAGTRTTANVTNTLRAERFLADILSSNENVPDQIDWRKQGNRVTRVKDQGKCRSSWAFVATGVLEGQFVSRGNGKDLIELSEQNLIDCIPGNSGCNVGLVEPSFWYAQKEGLLPEAAYPFASGQKSSCKVARSYAQSIKDRGYAILPRGNEEALRKVVARFGPVAAILPMVDGGENYFPKYKTGIYLDKNNQAANSCDTKRNHAVLIVGYGRDLVGGDYWIVKNSYGKAWGEGGYIRMARNRRNNAGIACNTMIAIF